MVFNEYKNTMVGQDKLDLYNGSYYCTENDEYLMVLSTDSVNETKPIDVSMYINDWGLVFPDRMEDFVTKEEAEAWVADSVNGLGITYSAENPKQLTYNGHTYTLIETLE